jgi:hypothetical protein
MQYDRAHCERLTRRGSVRKLDYNAGLFSSLNLTIMKTVWECNRNKCSHSSGHKLLIYRILCSLSTPVCALCYHPPCHYCSCPHQSVPTVITHCHYCSCPHQSVPTVITHCHYCSCPHQSVPTVFTHPVTTVPMSPSS